MNTEFFLAKRIYKSTGEKGNISSPAIKVAVAGIALGLAVMLLSISIIVGFKKEIRGKVIGFGSHIQITNIAQNSSYDFEPIIPTQELKDRIIDIGNISQIQEFANKAGVIKTDSSFQGVVLKGIGIDYDLNFINKSIIKGTTLSFSDSTKRDNSVLISQHIADKLLLDVGDDMIIYFIQKPMKARKLKISGIYQTHFDDYDKIFLFTDISLVRSVQGWKQGEVTGLEILLKDYNKIDETSLNIADHLYQARGEGDENLYSRSVKEMNPMIFNWLDLLDMNVKIVILLMLAVSGFTMISGLLIIIIERTAMIGILKTLGYRNRSIRKTFLYLSSFLITKGLIWGNLTAIPILFIQRKMMIIKLDPKTYFTDHVPIDISITNIIIINVVTLLVSTLVLIGPSYLIAKISPSKSINFE